MSRKVVLVLACLLLAATVQVSAAMQKFDCTQNVQNVSPDGMGQLNTVEVFEGSLIQLDGTQWRDAVTGEIPAVGFPGESLANVTRGSHILKVSLQDYKDFVANVTICEHGITEVYVRQVPVQVTTAVSGANSPVPSAAGTVPVPAPTKAPGFGLVTAMMAVAVLCISRKDS